MTVGKDIEAVSLAVQIDGKAYFVMMPQENLKLVANMAASLTDSGTLQVVPAPEGFKFTTIGELKGDN